MVYYSWSHSFGIYLSIYQREECELSRGLFGKSLELLEVTQGPFSSLDKSKKYKLRGLDEVPLLVLFSTGFHRETRVYLSGLFWNRESFFLRLHHCNLHLICAMDGLVKKWEDLILLRFCYIFVLSDLGSNSLLRVLKLGEF